MSLKLSLTTASNLYTINIFTKFQKQLLNFRKNLNQTLRQRLVFLFLYVKSSLGQLESARAIHQKRAKRRANDCREEREHQKIVRNIKTTRNRRRVGTRQIELRTNGTEMTPTKPLPEEYNFNLSYRGNYSNKIR